MVCGGMAAGKGQWRGHASDNWMRVRAQSRTSVSRACHVHTDKQSVSAMRRGAMARYWARACGRLAGSLHGGESFTFGLHLTLQQKERLVP